MAVAKKLKKKTSKSAVKKKVTTKKKVAVKKVAKAKGSKGKATSVLAPVVQFKVKLKPVLLETTAGPKQIFNDFKSNYIVIYFYPKDLTPGCTTEGIEFSKYHRDFKKLGAEILGVSRDKIDLHHKFKEKYNFNFDLIADVDEVLCRQFDVIQKKKLYGREYMGVVRSTFILDKKRRVVKSWCSVKVKGHVEEVLDALKQI